jgi:hypothetical protein
MLHGTEVEQKVGDSSNTTAIDEARRLADLDLGVPVEMSWEVLEFAREGIEAY